MSGLVNNAGVLERQMRVDAMESGRLQRVFATNVFDAFACAREAVRRMSTKHGGAFGWTSIYSPRCLTARWR